MNYELLPFKAYFAILRPIVQYIVHNRGIVITVSKVYYFFYNIDLIMVKLTLIINVVTSFSTQSTFLSFVVFTRY